MTEKFKPKFTRVSGVEGSDDGIHWYPIIPTTSTAISLKPTVDWSEAQRVCDLPKVDESIRGLLEDHTGDNATCMVRDILEAGREEAERNSMPVEQEPKYGIRENRLYNRMSGEFIPVDEPVFIFRARDMLAREAIEHYACVVMPGTHRDSVVQRVSDFAMFSHQHPERMKLPDTAVAEPCVEIDCGTTTGNHAPSCPEAANHIEDVRAMVEPTDLVITAAHEAACRKDWENFYHKVRADQPFDQWRQAWMQCLRLMPYRMQWLPKNPDNNPTNAEIVAIFEKHLFAPDQAGVLTDLPECANLIVAAFREVTGLPDYEAMEKEHFGDPDKRTGIYANERRPAIDVVRAIVACFDAAAAEGLEQIMIESTDERLKDLMRRRIMYAYMEAIEYLAGEPEQAVPGEGMRYDEPAAELNGLAKILSTLRIMRDRHGHDGVRNLYAMVIAQVTSLHEILTERRQSRAAQRLAAAGGTDPDAGKENN